MFLKSCSTIIILGILFAIDFIDAKSYGSNIILGGGSLVLSEGGKHGSNIIIRGNSGGECCGGHGGGHNQSPFHSYLPYFMPHLYNMFNWG